MNSLSIKLLLGLFFIFSFIQAQIVAEYGADFSNTTPSTGWRYLWNAPTGWGVGVTGDLTTNLIGTPSNYTPLVYGSGRYTPDGDAIVDNSPADFLYLDSTGGQGGVPYDEVTSPNRDRFAIVEYTLQTSGNFSIQNSFVRNSGNSRDGLEIKFALTSGAPLLTLTTSSGQYDATTNPLAGITFDQNLGFLAAGEKLYLYVGGKDLTFRDGFLMNFQIVQVPEPSTNAAIGLGLLFVCMFLTGRFKSKAHKQITDLRL